MTTTVNTSNSVSKPITSNPLGREIFPILEEVTAERTSDIALGTLQQQLSLVLKNQDQLSTELKQLSLKLSLILQNQDQLSKELKQPIASPCPPPPPPPPPPPSSPKTSLSLQTTTTLTSEIQLAKSMGNLCRSQSLRIKTSEGPIATKEQVKEVLKNLRSSKNGNETNLSLQTTAPALETKPSPLTKNFSQSQLKYIEKKQNENDKNSEIKENISVADKIKLFS